MRFLLLRAILFISNVTSLIINLLIVIFGTDFINSFVNLPRAKDETLRTFSIFECIICIIALVGIIRRHFYTFTLYTILLIVYIICAYIFTHVAVVWFFLLAIILISMVLVFNYFLYLYMKEQQTINRNDNSFQI